jgi:hypothetical protein
MGTLLFFVIMPNHFDGIVVITDTIVGADLVSALYRTMQTRPSGRTSRCAPTYGNPMI